MKNNHYKLESTERDGFIRSRSASNGVKIFSTISGKGRKRNHGVALLLVMSILAALASISFAMFNIAFSQIQIAGELSDSFIAFYAADEGIERLLYEDRVDPANLCATTGMIPNCYNNGNASFDNPVGDAFSGGCYYAKISKTDSGVGIAENKLEVTGQSVCGVGATRFVRRAFELTYKGPAP